MTADAINKLKPLQKDQLCYSWSETYDFIKDGKGIYSDNFQWSYAASWSNLHEITKRWAYSNAVFMDGHRAAANVAYLGNLLIYDYDDGITLKEMSGIISNLSISALMVTTSSHQKEKKGIVCDRFRLIIQLSKCIGTGVTTPIMEEILSEVDIALNLGKQYDESCKTIERYYAPAAAQLHRYYDGESIDISDIVATAKKPKPKPLPVVRAVTTYSSTGTSIKEQRAFVKENIPYDKVVHELEAKGLSVSRNGGIYLDRKKVGNISQETRMIANWAESEHLDIVAVLHKFYNEDYIENTKRLYKEIA